MTNADFTRVRRYSKPSWDSAIVPKISSIHQYSLLISDYRLTELLEALEKRGFTGDVAVLILAYLQEVAA
ncbi:hypothetical protein [uncultured Nostoc sp.]|uniref:hypothetical protein n=1 Tax=uncultured Nostoc sp. TaxID=340711 RepID=UPI0035CACEB0